MILMTAIVGKRYYFGDSNPSYGGERSGCREEEDDDEEEDGEVEEN